MTDTHKPDPDRARRLQLFVDAAGARAVGAGGVKPIWRESDTLTSGSTGGGVVAANGPWLGDNVVSGWDADP
ncbi:hypothetical protein [Lysobacter arvi]|uniref:Uncharacterized protein n=1 Tax=Lysobacter arvi TaxID=3038776 RepID=A0ABU1CD55_9GAMM|nr:hypothetical protein [Lysobacter arvi]MDR0183055.1 hypothetical protein [Lysobacter arvi]